MLRLTCLVGLCALAVPRPAVAKEAVPPRVEQLVKEMMTDYNTGNFEGALASATEAYRLKPLPALLFNLGQFHRALQHWERAEFFFHRYLDERPDAPNRELVLKLMAEVHEKALATRPAAAVEQTTPVPEAAVSEPTAKPKHPRVLALVLGGTGVAAGAVSIGAWIATANAGAVITAIQNGVDHYSITQQTQAQATVGTWQPVAIVLDVAAAICFGGTALTW